MARKRLDFKEDPIRWVVTEGLPRDWLARTAWRVLPLLGFDDYRSWTAKLQRQGFRAFSHHLYTRFGVQQVNELLSSLLPNELLSA